jgi:hypothetical protein
MATEIGPVPEGTRDAAPSARVPVQVARPPFVGAPPDQEAEPPAAAQPEQSFQMPAMQVHVVFGLAAQVAPGVEHVLPIRQSVEGVPPIPWQGASVQSGPPPPFVGAPPAEEAEPPAAAEP